MRSLKILILLLTTTTILHSCKKEIELNTEWKDVTIVYGILNQLDSIHYIKVTKAFLGPGNALQYAQIPDSSNYPYKMEVSLEAWNSTNQVAVYRFDTTTIHNKDSGQFYFPNQMTYANDSILDPVYHYKLVIRNPHTQKEILSETALVRDFTVERPFNYQAISFDPGKISKVEWISAEGGRLYQVIVRFYYLETSKQNPSQSVEKYVDWEIVPGKNSKNDLGGEEIIESYDNDGFYSLLHAKIPVDPDVDRVARILRYYFIVAAEDLQTYIEVSQPSNSIVQEKPAYSNIDNGIGLFSARFVKTVDSIHLSQRTKDELRANELTWNLGF